MSTEHGEFYLRETWGTRLMHLAAAAFSVAVAAVALGVTLISVLQTVLLLRAEASAWPLFGYLVCAVVGGVLTVVWARIFWDRFRATFRRIVIRSAEPTGAVTIGASSLFDAANRS
ncbi:hypothetical protein J2X55_003469 [Microbacterium sp. 1154]|uniref:hypothetical protein n=1 Tax=Microbacterium sp. 1154 TaxID=2817733 RepID=UPI00285E3BFD|nr:hypothetical protein [Microbacterium sp. 1154]MDR6692524.1 hypothetical protein [Microbacterium sp. 1154]